MSSHILVMILIPVVNGDWTGALILKGGGSIHRRLLLLSLFQNLERDQKSIAASCSHSQADWTKTVIAIFMIWTKLPNVNFFIQMETKNLNITARGRPKIAPQTTAPLGRNASAAGTTDRHGVFILN